MQIDLCNRCIHYLGDLKCAAFPKGIPDEILEGKNDHSKPLKGQKNKIVFEPINRGNSTDINLTPMPLDMVVKLIKRVQQKVLPYLTEQEKQAIKTYLDTEKTSQELDQAIKKGGFDFDLTLYIDTERKFLNSLLSKRVEGTYFSYINPVRAKAQIIGKPQIKIKTPRNLPKLPVKKWTGKDEVLLEAGSVFRVDYVDPVNDLVECTHFKRVK